MMETDANMVELSWGFTHRRREPGGALRVDYARAASSVASDSAPASRGKDDRCREEDMSSLYVSRRRLVKR